MAHYHKRVRGNFREILGKVHEAVLNGSMSASYEDGCEHVTSDYQNAVRVYERYSWTGSNRVSMTVSLTGADGVYNLDVITSGGSQGMIFKLNTFGEEAFLKSIESVVDKL